MNILKTFKFTNLNRYRSLTAAGHNIPCHPRLTIAATDNQPLQVLKHNDIHGRILPERVARLQRLRPRGSPRSPDQFTIEGATGTYRVTGGHAQSVSHASPAANQPRLPYPRLPHPRTFVVGNPLLLTIVVVLEFGCVSTVSDRLSRNSSCNKLASELM